ncbi:hypothetical protein PtA15_4A625 [Puccinia triticina]|uniref:Trafficking protein particle complex subunit n=1 Tax=Puccinia triticina TaxID=208348 RepID=A0ABY7CG45_9BASI|nr:uncharacterized protein PtA15_4A625 [Puccinia triticina]WAQ84173.1 hypothetical protein PtA15_4A625 [Puccinia triticina]
MSIPQGSRPLTFITMNTPKGQEFQEFAEQLKLVYHFAFTHHLMDVRGGQQRSDLFMKLNPNAEHSK